jgi:hypothetical protein
LARQGQAMSPTSSDAPVRGTSKVDSSESGSSRLEETAHQLEQRARELDGIYQATREAADSELKKTASGQRLLKKRHALGSKLAELHKNLRAGEMTFAEAQRKSHALREQFRSDHQAEFELADAGLARLQPSLEAITEILQINDVSEPGGWVAEIIPMQAVLLTPAASAVGVVHQGLGAAPALPPVHLCMAPPYARHATAEWSHLGAGTLATSTPATGQLFAQANGFADVVIPGGSAVAEASVGGNLAIPDGYRHCQIDVQFDFNASGMSWAVGGGAFCGASTRVSVDDHDGRTPVDTDRSLFHLVSVVTWGNGTNSSGNASMTVIHERSSAAAGQMSVMVGLGTQGAAWGFAGQGLATASVHVTEICVTLTA